MLPLYPKPAVARVIGPSESATGTALADPTIVEVACLVGAFLRADAFGL